MLHLLWHSIKKLVLYTNTMITFKPYFLSLNLHPFFYVTIALMTGILCQAYHHTHIIISMFLLSILIATRKGSHQHTHFIIILFLTFLLGALRYQQQQHNHENFYAATRHQIFDAIGIIENIETNLTTKFKHQITINLTKIKNLNDGSSWHTTNKKIYLYTQRIPSISVSDCVKLKKISFKEPSNKSFGNYLIKEGIAATIFMNPCNVTCIKRPHYSLARWFFNYKMLLLKKFKMQLSPHTFQLFSSIFLGNPHSKKETDDLKTQFKLWGIIHYLARSGLHLLIFIIVWNSIFTIIPLPFKYKQFFLLLIGFTYSILTWPSTSFNRAIITFFFHKIGKLFYVQTNFLHILTVVCFFFLLTNPIQLFFLDFQLSFGLTAALAWLNQLQIQNRCHLQTIDSNRPNLLKYQ